MRSACGHGACASPSSAGPSGSRPLSRALPQAEVVPVRVSRRLRRGPRPGGRAASRPGSAPAPGACSTRSWHRRCRSRGPAVSRWPTRRPAASPTCSTCWTRFIDVQRANGRLDVRAHALDPRRSDTGAAAALVGGAERARLVEGTLNISKRIDRATLVAIAVVAYALANLVHEGLGHGGACLLAGGRPVALSAIHFESDLGSLDVSRTQVARGGRHDRQRRRGPAGSRGAASEPRHVGRGALLPVAAHDASTCCRPPATGSSPASGTSATGGW